jgi:hypothetical protein
MIKKNIHKKLSVVFTILCSICISHNTHTAWLASDGGVEGFGFMPDLSLDSEFGGEASALDTVCGGCGLDCHSRESLSAHWRNCMDHVAVDNAAPEIEDAPVVAQYRPVADLVPSLLSPNWPAVPAQDFVVQDQESEHVSPWGFEPRDEFGDQDGAGDGDSDPRVLNQGVLEHKQGQKRGRGEGQEAVWHQEPEQQPVQKKQKKAHAKMSSGKNRHACTECGKSFTRKIDLTLHEHLHTGEALHLCKLCPKSFINATLLEDHERVHSGERPFECPTCGKGFKQRGHLDYHLTTHTEQKPAKQKPKESHACPVCNKTFTNKWDRDRHSKTHDANRPAGSHVCPVCQKACWQASDLEQHMRVHEGICEHTCSGCLARFNTKRALSSHKCLYTAGKETKKAKRKAQEAQKQREREQALVLLADIWPQQQQ